MLEVCCDSVGKMGIVLLVRADLVVNLPIGSRWVRISIGPDNCLTIKLPLVHMLDIRKVSDVGILGTRVQHTW